MAEVSSCKSKQSSLEKITKAAATTSPPQKSEVTVPPVDMSSQASMEEAEGSPEGIPTNISLIAAVCSSRSASPLVDASELQANANRAIDNMLHLKRSLDVKRQRATWEFGAILHQNESQGVALIAAAKAVCSQAVTEAKTNHQTAATEAKTTKHCPIQAAEVTCYKAISDAKAQTTSQAVMFQEEHYNYLQGLEEQALREESRSHQDILSSHQAALCYSPQLIRGALAASYHFTIGRNTSITFTRSAPKDPSFGRTDILSCSSHTDAQTVSETEKATSFTRADGEHAPGWSDPGSCGGRTSSPQEIRNPSLVQITKAQLC